MSSSLRRGVVRARGGTQQDLAKVGSHYDLAIALALLAAKGSIPGDALRSTAVFGELALDGRLRSVPGVLPAALSALGRRAMRHLEW